MHSLCHKIGRYVRNIIVHKISNIGSKSYIMSTKFNHCLRCASHISKSSAVQGSCVSSYLFILAVQNVLLTTHILL